MPEPSETQRRTGRPPDGVVGLHEPPFPPPGAPIRPRLSSVFGRLTFFNVAGGIATIVTGTLQARALGAEGRGELAAILVPLTLAPLLLNLALGTYAAREAASGRRSVNELIGSVGAPLLFMTVIGMVAGFPLARVLADGNDTVQTYLTIGFMLLPVSIAGVLFVALMAGLERWNIVIAQNAVPIAVSFVGIVAMYVLDEMTVARVVIVALVGIVFSIVPALVVIVGSGRPIFRPATARASVRFGLRTWPGGLALIANVRLDQFLMIVLVGDRELGLYAVAVTLAGLSYFLIGALSPPLMTRVAQGETALVPRALRIVLATMSCFNLAIVAVTPFALPAIFGAEFERAVDQAVVLLIASVPLAGIAILTAALAADGAPGKSSIGEGMALTITIPGLFLLVPSLGGLGAAIVSLAAYSASFTYQLHAMRHRLGGSLRSFLLPRAEDARWAVELVIRRRRSA